MWTVAQSPWQCLMWEHITTLWDGMENGPTQFFSAKRQAQSRGFVEESEITMKEVFDRVEQVWLLTKINGIPTHWVAMETLSHYSDFLPLWSLLARSCKNSSLMDGFFNTFIQRRFVLVDSNENLILICLTFVKSKQRRKTVMEALPGWFFFLHVSVVYSFHLYRQYLPFNWSVKFHHFPVTKAPKCIG